VTVTVIVPVTSPSHPAPAPRIRRRRRRLWHRQPPHTPAGRPACGPDTAAHIRGNRRPAAGRLLADDGSTVWSAKALRPSDVERLTVGQAPPGFRDTVPLAARPLDPQKAYDLQFLVLEPTGDPAASRPRGRGTDIDLAFGATVRFRPADLRPDRVWVDGRLVAADRFEQVSCADDQPT
jgi:hypothetical protein